MIQPREICKQMIDFNRTACDNAFNNMDMLHEYSEKAINLSLVQFPWFPEEGRKLVCEWQKAYKRGYNNLRVVADEQYRKLEVLFTQDDGAGSVETPKNGDKDQGARQMKRAKPSMAE